MKKEHKTSTGKVFQITDFKGNPLDYDEYKDVFSKNMKSVLECGQVLRSRTIGVELHRIK